MIGALGGEDPVAEDLRRRYGPSPLIDLQERLTDAIRRDLETTIGRDPVAAAGL